METSSRFRRNFFFWYRAMETGSCLCCFRYNADKLSFIKQLWRFSSHFIQKGSFKVEWTKSRICRLCIFFIKKAIGPPFLVYVNGHLNITYSFYSVSLRTCLTLALFVGFLYKIEFWSHSIYFQQTLQFTSWEITKLQEKNELKLFVRGSRKLFKVSLKIMGPNNKRNLNVLTTSIRH